MNIVLFGSAGSIGKLILKELIDRGHSVTTVMHKNTNVLSYKQVRTISGNILNSESIAKAAKGHDAVISAFGPGKDLSGQVVDAAHALLAGLQDARVNRLIVVGGAGSLKVASGQQLVDTSGFPLAVKPVALAHREALEVYKSANLDWTFFSPPISIRSGHRTGKFRLGGDRLLVDANGKSEISIEDFATALVDELEQPQFLRKQLTVAY